MAVVDGLGRTFNVVSLADTVGINVSGATNISYIFTTSGAASAVFTAAKTFAGSYDNFSTANGFGQPTRWYQTTSDTGTAAWTKQTASWSTATLTLSGTTGYTSVVTFTGAMLADGYKYMKVTCTNATVVAVLHDLTVQRTPANLAILGA